MSNDKQNNILKLLVCDSDTRLLKRLESWIKAMGHEVTASSDGLESLKLYKNEIPDVLIVSQKINNIGVIEFIEKIEEIYHDQAIIMTLNEDLDGVIFKRSIDLTVDKYINKPIDATTLFNAIDYLSKILGTKKMVKTQAIDAKIQKLEHIKEVNKVKDSFLTVFTHELRTPLNAIINFSEYVQKHLAKESFVAKEKLSNQLVEINSAGWVMLDMINNLIDAIKLKDNRLELNFLEVSLKMTIDDILSKYSHKYIEIKFIKDNNEDCFILGDVSRIKQILNNLISNAVKYTDNIVSISLISYNDNFQIVIEDNGKGFKDKTKVVNLFEQSGEDDMTRTAKGAGVGLYVVRGLCAKMNFDFKIDDSIEFGGAKVIISGKKGL